MYKIYWVNMTKAGYANAGKRPVVCIDEQGDKLKVLEITSRNKNDRYHAHMNNYLIRGYCDCGTTYKVNKKFVLSYVRECTLEEQTNIDKRREELDNAKKAG